LKAKKNSFIYTAGRFLARAVIDWLTYDDCMRNGGLNARDPEEARANCMPGGAYASARAFETNFPQPGF